MRTKSYWLIIVFSWLIILFLLGVDVWLFGPDIFTVITRPKHPPLISEIDPKSEAFAVASILPQVNMMCLKTRELNVQNEWLMRSLDKCIKKIESERSLKPIPLKPLFKWEPNDANRVLKITEPNEPLFMPCIIPIDYSVTMQVRGDGTDISRLKSLMNLNLWGMTNEKWIENFKERLKRLDPNRPLQKRSE